MRVTRSWLPVSLMATLAILALVWWAAYRPAPSRSAILVRPSTRIPGNPKLRGYTDGSSHSNVPEDDDADAPSALMTVQIRDRSTGEAVPGVLLKSAREEFTSDESGKVTVPARVLESLTPASDVWRAAPPEVDEKGVLWMVGRLLVRAHCTRAGEPISPSEECVARVRLLRPIGVSVADLAEKPQIGERDRWIFGSDLARERHRLPVLPDGIVEILTWETPSQAVTISVGGVSSAPVVIPRSAARFRGSVPPVVEVDVPLEDRVFHVSGKVASDEGQPIVGVEVVLVLLRRMDASKADPSLLKPDGHTLGIIKRGDEDMALVSNKLTATTRHDGSFRFTTPIDAHESLLVVHQKGYMRGSQRLPQLSSANTSDVEIRLTPALPHEPCVLRIGDSDAPAGRLTFIDARSEPQFHFSVEVTSEGRFDAIWLEPGRIYHLVYMSREDNGFISGNFMWDGASVLDTNQLERHHSTMANGTDGTTRGN